MLRVSWPLLHLLVGLAAVGVYYPSLEAPFIYDDISDISTNSLVQEIDPGIGITWSLSRPVTQVSFALNWAWWGPNVVGFHVVNLALHILASLLLLNFARGLGLSPLGAGAASLLFTVHPALTQSVTYIVQRGVLLATCGYLAALVLLLASRRRYDRGGWRAPWHLLTYTVALVFALQAMFSKEIAATLPAVALLMLWTRRRDQVTSQVIYVAPFFLPLVLLASTLIGDDSVQSEITRSVAPGSYLMTQIHVVWTYLRLLVAPYGLRMLYDYPMAEQLTPVTVGAALLHLLILGVGLWLRRAAPLITLGVLWFYVTLAVESGPIPIPHVIFEHRLYLPAVGFMLVLAVGVERLGGRHPLFGGALVVVVALALGTATFARNQVWRDPVEFWASNFVLEPDHQDVAINLAGAHIHAGQHDDAVLPLVHVLHRNPHNHFALLNLCEVHVLRGDRGLACEVCGEVVRRKLELDPSVVKHLFRTYPDRPSLCARVEASRRRVKEGER